MTKVLSVMHNVLLLVWRLGPLLPFDQFVGLIDALSALHIEFSKGHLPSYHCVLQGLSNQGLGLILTCCCC
jgi:hypothetical protein